MVAHFATPPAAGLRYLILGAAVGMSVDNVRVFIESLRDCDYSGDVMLLVRPYQWRLKSYLASRGVKTFHDYSVREIDGPIYARRFFRFADYLREHGDRYDQVLFADVRDVMFQKHPFIGIASQTCHFFLESARFTIGSEESNDKWARRFLKPDEAEKIRSCRISCCGVTLGDTRQMIDYVNHLVAAMRALPWWLRRRKGADTALHNRILHLTREVPAIAVENNLHVATMCLEPQADYRLEQACRVVRLDGHMPAILHQYDRHPKWREAIKAHYAARR